MSEAKQIYQLIPKVMHDVGAIGKGRQNLQQKYAFRGIDDMYNAIQPVLIKHGVFVCPSVIDQKREERQTKSGSTLIYTVLTVRHTLYAPDGSSVEAITVGEAMDSGDKSANKAMSAAMKYALIEVFSIPTEGDNDTENSSPEPTVKIDMGKLDEEFRKRGFNPEQADAAISAALKLWNRAKLENLTFEEYEMLLTSVRDGRADKFKNGKVTANA